MKREVFCVEVTSEATDHHRRLERALVRYGVTCEVGEPRDSACEVVVTYDPGRYDETAFKIIMSSVFPVVASPPIAFNKSAWCLCMLEKS